MIYDKLREREREREGGRERVITCYPTEHAFQLQCLPQEELIGLS